MRSVTGLPFHRSFFIDICILSFASRSYVLVNPVGRLRAPAPAHILMYDNDHNTMLHSRHLAHRHQQQAIHYRLAYAQSRA